MSLQYGFHERQSQSSLEMYSPSIKETQDEMSIVGRDIQLTKDYTTGNATFKQGRVEGQLLRHPHVRTENGKLSSIVI